MPALKLPLDLRSSPDAPPSAPAPPPPPPPPEEPGTFEEEILFRLDALLELPHPVDKLSPVYLEGKDVIKVVHSLASGAEPSQFAFDQVALIANGNNVVHKLSACLNLAFVCGEKQDPSDAETKVFTVKPNYSRERGREDRQESAVESNK